MHIEQFYVEGIAHLSYLVGGKTSCAIVDPKRDVEEYIAAAKRLGLTITHILETHLHADFVSGHVELARLTGAKIYAPRSGGCTYDHVAVGEGDSFDIEDMQVKVLDTPGHTPDGVCFVVTDRSRGDEPAAVFTGDTLFVGDVGRPDLFPGRGDELASQLFENLHKLLRLPDACLVYPAHGAGSLCGKAMGAMRVSTIGYERRFNPALQFATEAEFKTALLDGMPEAPDHFARCSDINRRGAGLVAEMPSPRPIFPKELQSLVEQGHIVLDTRDYSAFGGAHVPGAYNIDAAHNFSTFAGWLLPPDKPIVLVAAANEQVSALATMLRRVGLDRVVGYLDRGMGPWIVSGMPIDHIPTTSIFEVKRCCDEKKKPATLLDVRALGEWELSHINGAIHMPLPATRNRHDELDREATTVLVCKSGARASTAGSILQRNGFKNLTVMAGGMTAWTAAGLAPECATCALTHGPRTNY
ncbi:MAG: MBL fold metallo-hydrolase [Thermoguttaceae bacterium]|jgi:hydroxyacylglutathione hydrolase